ncbi:MAG: hypothetical protein JW743_04165 [Deltaproteobacteria bacterium]|nr:hypothetical protein [Deltaproteobacteria bacterium]MBN2844791.1 hypothetical protein [Deltaproteobacteria bacterium]
MKRKLLFFIAVVVGVMIVVAPLSSAVAADPKINAMTRNLYLGADIFKVVEAAQTDPDTIPYVVADVFQTAMYTNFPARAEAIADEIARYKPQVVGLQEVSTYFIQTPGDFMDGNPTPAEDVVIDFYTVLDAALKARGMEYDAFTVDNADIEVPMINPSSPTFLSDVRLVDHDVILVRKGHDAVEVLNDNYQAQLVIDLGGIPVSFSRGYLAVDVDVKGTTYRVVNTHLEVRSAPRSVFRVFQSWQMQELLGTVYYMNALDPKPTLLIADWNSSSEDVPDMGYVPGMGWVPYTPPYMQAVGAGYLDSWLLQDKYDDGYTSGFDEYVSDPDAELTSRIDIIWLAPDTLTLDKVSATVVGEEEIDMVPNTYPGAPEDAMLWPSDHAGVVAKIKFLE